MGSKYTPFSNCQAKSVNCDSVDHSNLWTSLPNGVCVDCVCSPPENVLQRVFTKDIHLLIWCAHVWDVLGHFYHCCSVLGCSVLYRYSSVFHALYSLWPFTQLRRQLWPGIFKYLDTLLFCGRKRWDVFVTVLALWVDLVAWLLWYKEG